MQETIKSEINESTAVNNEILKSLVPKIEEITTIIVTALKNGNKILIAGNGGSASDSQHFAAELIGRFKKERKALPAISLTTDSSITTSVGNDYGFDKIFSRQIEGLGNKGDIFIGISTSGNSINIIEAINISKQKNVKTIAFLGNDGGQISKIADISLIVPSRNTPRIQESHITIIHIICRLIEEEMFS